MEAGLETQTIAVGLGVAPIIALLINPLKGRLVPHDLMLYVAIGVALSWTLVYHWSVGELARDTIMASILLGITTGAAASGSYDILSGAADRSGAVARLASALTVLPGNDEEVDE